MRSTGTYHITVYFRDWDPAGGRQMILVQRRYGINIVYPSSANLIAGSNTFAISKEPKTLMTSTHNPAHPTISGQCLHSVRIQTYQVL